MLKRMWQGSLPELTNSDRALRRWLAAQRSSCLSGSPIFFLRPTQISVCVLGGTVILGPGVAWLKLRTRYNRVANNTTKRTGI